MMARFVFAGMLAIIVGGAAAANDDRLVYADFETMEDGRPVSARGGRIQIIAYQENASAPATFKGLEGADPPAPNLVRTSKEDENRAIAFEYDLKAPNQFAGVGVEISGRPEENGKTVPDDVSDYKFLVLQMYSKSSAENTLPVSIRIEFLSRGHNMDVSLGYPQFNFKAKPGFNTYKVKMNDVAQPSWASVQINVEELMEKLTGVSITTYCDNCRPQSGLLLIDNLVFEK
jgi:hypothetical protein